MSTQNPDPERVTVSPPHSETLVGLTDAMAATLGSGPFHGLRFEGRRFDCGDKAGFLEATIAFALARDDLAPAMRDILKSYADA